MGICERKPEKEKRYQQKYLRAKCYQHFALRRIIYCG